MRHILALTGRLSGAARLYTHRKDHDVLSWIATKQLVRLLSEYGVQEQHTDVATAVCARRHKASP